MVQKDNINEKLISYLLNHLSSYMGLLKSKLSSSYARFFGYHAANEYYKTKD